MTRTAPIVDTGLYTVVIAGTRKAFANRAAAFAHAVTIVTEWQDLGYRRVARVYYRDGGLVAEVTL